MGRESSSDGHCWGRLPAMATTLPGIEKGALGREGTRNAVALGPLEVEVGCNTD